MNYFTAEEETTIKYYDENAEEWSAKHSTGTFFDSDMDMFFELLTKGKVLEIGSGHGGDAKRLIAHYGVDNYVGTDVSKGLLKVAKRTNPEGRFVNVSIYNLESLEEKFDGFWASGVLIHIPKNKLDNALEKIYNLLNQGAAGFISIMEGSADMEASRPGRHYSLWMSDEFEKELASSNFEIVNKRRIETNASPWLSYIVKRV